MLRVENCNVKFLDRQILEPLGENLVHIARPSNRNTILALLGSHPTTKLERCMDRNRASVSDPIDGSESSNRLR